MADSESSEEGEVFDIGASDSEDEPQSQPQPQDLDHLIRDPAIHSLLQPAQPPSSLASDDDLRKVTSDLSTIYKSPPLIVTLQAFAAEQLAHAHLKQKFREMYLELLTFKAAKKKTRNRNGGLPPPELAEFVAEVSKSGAKLSLLYDLWPADDAFEARRRPDIDLWSPCRYESEALKKSGRQAEIFNAMPYLSEPHYKLLKKSMGSVKWIKNCVCTSLIVMPPYANCSFQMTSACSTQKSHLVYAGKTGFHYCLPCTLGHLPLDNPAKMATNPTVSALRGTKDDKLPAFMFPLDKYRDMRYAFRSRIMVKVCWSTLLPFHNH